jgi:peptide/nickel transport system ATP-binding protein
VLEPDPDVAPRLTADDAVELSPPKTGCPFQRRCPRKLGSICETDIPTMQEIAPGHVIHCHIPRADL